MSIEKKPSNVICLGRTHLPVGGSDKDVADLLMELIRKAERGELLGISVAYVEGNNNIGIRIATGGADAGLMAGAVSALNWEINRRWAF